MKNMAIILYAECHGRDRRLIGGFEEPVTWSLVFRGIALWAGTSISI